MFSLSILQSALELGCIYSLVALALFLSFRVLNIADMTTDGAFTLGCAVSAHRRRDGPPPSWACSGLAAGAAAGAVTALLQTRLGVPSILAGIVTNTGLYTVNLAVMGFSSMCPCSRPPRSLRCCRMSSAKILPTSWSLPPWRRPRPVRCWSGSSARGSAFPSAPTGDNPDMVRASSINTAYTILVGPVRFQLPDRAVGRGACRSTSARPISTLRHPAMVVIGLASLIIGETIFARGGIWVKALGAVGGSILYRFIIALALRANVPSECLKLLSAVIGGWPSPCPPSAQRRLLPAAAPPPNGRGPLKCWN